MREMAIDAERILKDEIKEMNEHLIRQMPPEKKEQQQRNDSESNNEKKMHNRVVK